MAGCDLHQIGRLSAENMAQPSKCFTVNAYGIKAACGCARIALQKKLGALPQAGLLHRRNAGGRATKLPAAALSDLDKDQRVGIAHDEINLAATTTKVSFDQNQPLRLQIGQRAIFGKSS